MAATAAAVLACLSIQTAVAQDAAPAAVVVNATLDAGNRSIRLEPLSVSVPLADSIAIDGFQPLANFFGLYGKWNGTRFMIDVAFDLRVPILNCDNWKSPNAIKAPKNAAAIHDPRWVAIFHKDKKASLCLSTPRGIVKIEGAFVDIDARQAALLSISTNLADALMPETAQPKAAAAAPEPAVSVANVIPSGIQDAAQLCQAGYEIQCMAVENFRTMQTGCSGGNATYCEIVAKSYGKREPRVAAAYFRRACQLGSKASCSKAAAAEKKAGS